MLQLMIHEKEWELVFYLDIEKFSQMYISSPC